ncbi:MAG: hypothetical protein QNJ54_01675 [Prochloraceae cyanobacterium]|nr:hypothetical protein [Prochloraceae cyanobacterium]
MSDLIFPARYQIVRHFVDPKRGGAWDFIVGKTFYNPRNVPFPEKEVYRHFGLTKKDIIIQLFRIGTGKLGYYLVNLRDRKYYYCGKDWEDVREKFKSLGIGRKDPSG